MRLVTFLKKSICLTIKLLGSTVILTTGTVLLQAALAATVRWLDTARTAAIFDTTSAVLAGGVETAATSLRLGRPHVHLVYEHMSIALGRTVNLSSIIYYVFENFTQIFEVDFPQVNRSRCWLYQSVFFNWETPEIYTIYWYKFV